MHVQWRSSWAKWPRWKGLGRLFILSSYLSAGSAASPDPCLYCFFLQINHFSLPVHCSCSSHPPHPFFPGPWRRQIGLKSFRATGLSLIQQHALNPTLLKPLSKLFFLFEFYFLFLNTFKLTDKLKIVQPASTNPFPDPLVLKKYYAIIVTLFFPIYTMFTSTISE